jgi:hypothetical protein
MYPKTTTMCRPRYNMIPSFLLGLAENAVEFPWKRYICQCAGNSVAVGFMLCVITIHMYTRVHLLGLFALRWDRQRVRCACRDIALYCPSNSLHSFRCTLRYRHGMFGECELANLIPRKIEREATRVLNLIPNDDELHFALTGMFVLFSYYWY